jgi:hypothetical protein
MTSRYHVVRPFRVIRETAIVCVQETERTIAKITSVDQSVRYNATTIDVVCQRQFAIAPNMIWCILSHS